jgi:hypothetical protein
MTPSVGPGPLPRTNSEHIATEPPAPPCGITNENHDQREIQAERTVLIGVRL